jgi:hypothetical protein
MFKKSSGVLNFPANLFGDIGRFLYDWEKITFLTLCPAQRGFPCFLEDVTFQLKNVICV